MDWVERWIPLAPDDIEVVVQHGTSRAPKGAIGHVLLAKSQLTDLMAAADAIVVQGGPGGIMDSRRLGQMPIAVPRRADLGEHVDNHQVAFCQQMAARQKVILAENEDDFRAALDAVLADPAAYRVDNDTEHVAAAIARFGDLVDQLVAEKRRK